MQPAQLILFLFAILYGLLMGGCASSVAISQVASAQVIPCAAQDIQMSNHRGAGVLYWNATCKGKVYNCSGTQPGNATRQNVSCIPVGK